jgi:hypothetical protein
MNEDPPDYEVDLLDACKAASALENTHVLPFLKYSSELSPCYL